MFDDLSVYGDSVAIASQTNTTSYVALEALVRAKAKFVDKGKLVVIGNPGQQKLVEHVSAYLTCVRKCACAMMFPDTKPSQAIIESFQPDTIVLGNKWETTEKEFVPCICELLITTSGSTGTKKFVKLTKQNLEANARAILRNLPIVKADVACLLLTPTYSYGLSIVNTHVLVGATLYVASASFGSRLFWKEISGAGVTSIGLVPSHLEIIEQQRFEDFLPRTLRYVTVSGGRSTPANLRVMERLRAAGIKVFAMYGQTETTTRTTILQDGDFPTHKGSVGRKIDGELFVVEGTGEIAYRGPNVFVGYAENRSDLGHVEKIETLHTGDVGRIEDGYLWLTGRIKRIAKINSVRVSLDELEDQLEVLSHTPVKCVSDEKYVYAFSIAPIVTEGLPLRSRIRSLIVDSIPCLQNGKTDYNLLETKIDEFS